MRSAFTSAKRNCTSYPSPIIPFFTATTEAGPHWNFPVKKRKIVILRIRVPTVRNLLRSGIYGLPTTVTSGQVWPGHVDLIPYMKVPDRIMNSIFSLFFFNFLPIFSEELIYAEWLVSVMRRHKAWNWPPWNANSPANWKNVTLGDYRWSRTILVFTTAEKTQHWPYFTGPLLATYCSIIAVLPVQSVGAVPFWIKNLCKIRYFKLPHSGPILDYSLC